MRGEHLLSRGGMSGWADLSGFRIQQVFIDGTLKRSYSTARDRFCLPCVRSATLEELDPMRPSEQPRSVQHLSVG